MAPENKHVVFDVVGTCISYENYYEALEARVGERFRQFGVGTRIFGYAWMEAGEREYTYLSIAGKYVTFFEVFRAIFYRTLWQAGIAEPRKHFTDEDREFLLDSYRKLKPRPGLAECFDRLRKGGFQVWMLTAGDTARVGGYLKDGGIDFPEDHFVSCDTIGIGKPAPESYQYILDKFDKENRETWFAAAHMWDVSGARPVGFKTAWVSFWEKEQCNEIFGQMDAVADDLPSLADAITAASSKK